MLTRQDFFFYKEKSYVQKKIFKRKKKKRGLPVVLKHINRIIIDATNIYHTYILYSLTYTLHTQNDISPPKNIFSSLREIRLHKPDTSPLLYSTQREYLLELGKNNWKSRLEKNLHIAQDNKKITEIFLVCLNFICNIWAWSFFPL